ncbi:uncharacterized protein B0I36DRAFT_343856 [Microdochium trichocladiopsis]|uniref:Uncharacterized protein n=1 Tax=Microdochium trichocladiopsis TaxID=1682393 RepID=A0A9P8YHI4_9PEZI|nr:uncharacterized protein B0I36DRAFT_343856 [Microdochium trichocladiopsis]KAH7040053.1 hypothetical protein B0I36DRAFT_343856 [Microdochium trichocladiopsis]
MDDFDNDAMAQAMGFASFGAQKPPSSKRRKFNPAADAVVAAPELSIPAHKPPPSSAANAVPLGIRPRATNADEIDLGDDDDDEHNDETSAPTTTTTTTNTTSENASEAATAVSGTGLDSTGHSHSTWARRGGGGTRGRTGQPAKPNWWADYYDPSSNINPWERLERERGLQPRGPWMTWEEAKSKA